MASNKIFFIVNPVAGGRDKQKFAGMLKKEFSGELYRVDFLYTAYPSHAYEAACRESEAGTRFIVAVGGDGTINEVARALVNSDAALGVIPFGSGNGFARHFGIPLNIKKALRVIRNGRVEKIDFGMINDDPFFCTTGLGFDAETGHQFRNYNRRGFFSYAFSFLKAFMNYRPQEYHLKVDQDPINIKAYFVNIANISQFGYHFYVAPKASAQDGKLDMIILKEFPKFISPVLVLRSFRGTIHKSRYVMARRAKEISLLEPEGKKAIHIDGEPAFANGKIVYSAHREGLNVILP